MPSITSRTNQQRVFGIDQLAGQLKGLKSSLARSIVKRSMVAGVKVVAAKARQLAPVQNVSGGGTLKKGIFASVQKRERRKDEYWAAVNFKAPPGAKGGKAKKAKGGAILKQKNPRKYAHLVEFGTKPHSLAKGAGKRGTRIVREGAQHPGAKPHPFLRPAFDQEGSRAVDVIAAQFIADVEAAMSGNKLGSPIAVSASPAAVAPSAGEGAP